jgi:hypothetical protein
MVTTDNDVLYILYYTYILYSIVLYILYCTVLYMCSSSCCTVHTVLYMYTPPTLFQLRRESMAYEAKLMSNGVIQDSRNSPTNSTTNATNRRISQDYYQLVRRRSEEEEGGVRRSE